MGVELRFSGVAGKGQARISSLGPNESLAHFWGGQNIKEGWCKQMRKRGQRESEDGGSNDNKNENDTHFQGTW